MENMSKWPPQWPTLDGIPVDAWVKKLQWNEPGIEEIEEIDIPDPFLPCVLPDTVLG